MNLKHVRHHLAVFAMTALSATQAMAQQEERFKIDALLKYIDLSPGLSAREHSRITSGAGIYVEKSQLIKAEILACYINGPDNTTVLFGSDKNKNRIFEQSEVDSMMVHNKKSITTFQFANQNQPAVMTKFTPKKNKVVIRKKEYPVNAERTPFTEFLRNLKTTSGKPAASTPTPPAEKPRVVAQPMT